MKFLNKIIVGHISCPAVMEAINFTVPRTIYRSSVTFYYDMPNTFHHDNNPLLRCLKLYTGLPNDFDVGIYTKSYLILLLF